eukprot:2527250-Amphidinium_carterae.1
MPPPRHKMKTPRGAGSIQTPPTSTALTVSTIAERISRYLTSSATVPHNSTQKRTRGTKNCVRTDTKFLNRKK